MAAAAHLDAPLQPSQLLEATQETIDDYFDWNASASNSTIEASAFGHFARRRLSTVSDMLQRSLKRLAATHPTSTSMQRSVDSDGFKLPTTTTTTTPDKLIQDETIMTGRVQPRVYLDYMRSASFAWSLTFIVFFFGYAGFRVGRNFWLSDWSSANDETVGDSMPVAERLLVYGAYGVAESVYTNCLCKSTLV